MDQPLTSSGEYAYGNGGAHPVGRADDQAAQFAAGVGKGGLFKLNFDDDGVDVGRGDQDVGAFPGGRRPACADARRGRS